MQVYSNHIVFNSVTYDRPALIDWYHRHQHLTMNFAQWINSRTGTTFRSGGAASAQTINLDGALGRLIKDEPEIAPLTQLFRVSRPFGAYDVDIMIYPPGYTLKAHTDHAMQCGIMFPILPDTPAAIDFYHAPPGREVVPSTEYTVLHHRDLDYSYAYSTVHPSMFRSTVIHGVRNISYSTRVFLRFKCLYDSFDSVAAQGDEFVNSSAS